MKAFQTFVKANIWFIAAAAAIAILLYQFVDPAPPQEITIATGSESGRYYELAQQITQPLKKDGISLKVLSTAGSAENLELLSDDTSNVSIAFVQSGMDELFDAGEANLHGLASLYYEPIWIFYRHELQPALLTDLTGRKIAIGEAGSGTYAVAEFLLKENGLTAERGNVELFAKGGEEAIDLLLAGEIDVAFFTISAASNTTERLVASPDIDFMDMTRHQAYRARYPFLSSALVSEGLLSLEKNLPAADKQVLASVATVVVNEKFHPSLTPVVLEALAGVLKKGGLLERRDEFPSPQSVGYPLTSEADHYFEYGPPFLLRYMPFWAASLVDRLIIFIIPLLVILIPLGKMVGPLYRWRIRSRIYRWYKYLRETDRKIVAGTIQEELDTERRKLENLETELASVEVPLSYSDELYFLRQHVEYVSRRITNLDRQTEGPASVRPRTEASPDA